MTDLKKLCQALLRSAKHESVQGQALIICANLKILKMRPNDEGLKIVIFSQINELSLVLRRQPPTGGRNVQRYNESN
jgi:hypothetical protein